MAGQARAPIPAASTSAPRENKLRTATGRSSPAAGGADRMAAGRNRCHKRHSNSNPIMAAKGTPVGLDRHIRSTTGMADRYRRRTTSSNEPDNNKRFKDS